MALAAVCLAGAALAGCSLPGRAFPGGPSPWLPGGAPGSVYATPAASTPAPTPITRSGPAAKRTPDLHAADATGLASWIAFRSKNAQSVTMPALFSSRTPHYSMIASLLVVCTGNICRSPMAEALFVESVRGAGQTIAVASAGTAALVGYPPPQEARAVMMERGIDIGAHRGRQITAELARGYDLILVMETQQQRFIESKWPMLKGRVRRLGEWRNEDVRDPYGDPKEAYERSLVQIEAGVGKWSEALPA